MKKLLLLCACLLALASPLWAVVAPPADIVVVRVRDAGGNFQVFITRGPGKSELLEFEGGVSDKKTMQASEGYYTFLSKLYQEGYKLQNSFTGANTNLTTLIFVKVHE